ncbi:MAG: hypothetical protein ACHQCE_15260, partial [Streptosporangiales bacterium]
MSRTTIRAALSTLAAEGLVVTRKGFGSYVRDRPPLRRVSSTHRHASHRASGKPEFDTEAISQGQVPSRRMLMTGRGPVPADVAGWLGCQAGDLVVLGCDAGEGGGLEGGEVGDGGVVAGDAFAEGLDFFFLLG